MTVELIFAKISDITRLPTRQADSIGWDLYSYGDHILSPGETKIIPTGFYAALPKDYAAFVWDRSSFGAAGIHIFRQMIINPTDAEENFDIVTFGGVIDWSYRGSWGVILHSFLKEPYTIVHGARVAQFVVHRIEEAKVTEITIEEFNKLKTLRGAKGLGSSEGKTAEQAQKEIASAKSGGKLE